MSKLLAMMMKPKNYMYATIKGSLTENNGVFSGFSNSDYLELQNTITLSKNSNIEIIEKINKPSDKNSNSLIGTATRYGFSLQINSSGRLLLYIGNGSTWSVSNGHSGTNILDDNTDYYIKIKIFNSLFNVYISTDNINYTLDNSYDISSLTTEEQYNLRLGMARTTTNYFNGSIDLNQSYIKINNTKYQLQAVVGYTVVGSPTIVNGVLINPTDKENTIKTSQTLNVNDNAWEMQFCLLNPTKKPNFFFRINDNNNTRCTMSTTYSFILFPNYQQDSSVVLRALGTFWAEAIDNSAPKVYLKIKCLGKDDNNEYPFIFSGSLDGINWTTETVISPIPLANGEIQISSYQSYSTGTEAKYNVDLNETWIKINNKLWFNGQPE